MSFADPEVPEVPPRTHHRKGRSAATSPLQQRHQPQFQQQVSWASDTSTVTESLGGDSLFSRQSSFRQSVASSASRRPPQPLSRRARKIMADTEKEEAVNLVSDLMSPKGWVGGGTGTVFMWFFHYYYCSVCRVLIANLIGLS